MSLSQLRKSLRSARRAITPVEREEKSLLLAQNLARYLPFRRCKKFAVYLSLPEEVDTSPVIELAQLLRKAIYLPVINTRVWQNQSMMFAQYLPGETPLRENRFGIREPAVKPGNYIPSSGLVIVAIELAWAEVITTKRLIADASSKANWSAWLLRANGLILNQQGTTYRCMQ